MIAPFLERLDQEGVSSMNLAKVKRLPLARLGLDVGMTHVLHVPLRRGQEIVGLQSAVYRRRPEPFTTKQERMMRGIAQLASLALENARLVDELADANRVKTDFVATMSHELRTPLNVIVGYTDMLLERSDGDVTPQQEERLTRISASARELLDLISATLDLGRLEAGRLDLALKRFSVPDLVEEVAGEIRELTRKPGVRLEWRIPRELPEVCTDPLKLKVVLKNLIGNALKFTEQGEIVVSAELDNGGINFCVSDTGVGISPGMQAKVFDAFTQGEEADAIASRGVGLGLYIVRRLVEIVRGTIVLESAPGVGSQFYVWLPLALDEQGGDAR
jgi:signal transduction histidine kinase